MPGGGGGRGVTRCNVVGMRRDQEAGVEGRHSKGAIVHDPHVGHGGVGRLYILWCDMGA